MAVKDLIASGKLKGTIKYFGTPAEEAAKSTEGIVYKPYIPPGPPRAPGN
jgi:hypothetical protein